MMSAPAELRNVTGTAGKVVHGDAYDHTVAIPPMPDYNGRILAYTATAAIIVTGVLQNVFPQWLLWMVAGALIWPHITHLLTRRTFLQIGRASCRERVKTYEDDS